MDLLLSDVRSGVRMLVKYPTLSIGSVLTLGLGIGLSTTVFSVVNGGLFRGLPVPDGGRVVYLVTTNPSQNQPRGPVNVHDLAVWEERQTSFERIGAFAFAPMNLSSEEGRPERYSGGQLTVAAFEALGIQPMLGRGFRAGDDRPGAEPVVLLSYGLWRDRYGSGPGIVGTAIRASGLSRTVIGVMPETFGFPIREALWTPLVVEPLATQRGHGPSLQVIARLKPGVSLAQAQSQARTIAADLEREFPETNRGLGAAVVPYAINILGPEIFGTFFMAFGVCALLLAAAGLYGVMSFAVTQRTREMGVRVALGAQGGQLIGLVMRKSVVLLGVGLVLGLGLALLASGALQPVLYHVDPRDGAVFAAVVVTLAAASLVASFLPARRVTRIDPVIALANE